MSTPLPPLALEMSMEGIALHQLAFDGHWHEMSRISLDDAALREKMAAMRASAIKLHGRKMLTRIWLPDDQVIHRDIQLSGGSDSARKSEAQKKIAELTPYNAAAFQVKVGEQNEDGSWPVIGVRKSTLSEARVFAKSHGFNGTAYSTRSAQAGFVDQPHFTMPANVKNVAKYGVIAASVAGLVVAVGFAFSTLDWQSWWYSSPRVEDVAPYRGADIPPDNSAQNILPAGLPVPVISPVAAIPASTTPDPFPELPAPVAAASAQVATQSPLAPVGETAEFSLSRQWVRPDLPKVIEAMAQAGPIDDVPNFGPFNLTIDVAEPPLPRLASIEPQVFSADPAVARARQPDRLTPIRFQIGALPSLINRMSPVEIAEVSSSFGIPLADLGVATPVVNLTVAPPVEVTAGLPPLLPRLRSGRPIPEQVPVPEVAQTPAADGGLQILQGQPSPRPLRRPVLPVSEPAANGGLQIFAGRPAFTIRHRPPEPEPVVETPVTQTPAPDEPLVAQGEPPRAEPGIRIVEGLPDKMPVLRSGQEIPEQGVAMMAAIPVSDLTPEMIEAIRLRPIRRPQSIIEMPAPVDPMLSNAAPATVLRPEPRNDAFNLNAARIAELLSNRPRSNAPPVPQDPPSINLPTSASVAREATIENGINLRKTSLIGIIGTNDARRAIIRLSGGRFVRVQLGESFSGWRVVAINETSVRIQKGRREEILRLP